MSLLERYSERSQKRKRARELGINFGRYQTGRLNAITDVHGVKVGHKTLIEGTGKRRPGSGPIRTGITAILPSERIFDQKLVAGGFILNGAGEVSGLTQLMEWGLIETPICLTNTMSVGQVADGVNSWMSKKYENIWNDQHVILPVVGECDDSFLNDSVGLHVKKQHVFETLDLVRGGPVPEGCVGAGTGMICCDFKAGIGTSSRVIKIDGKSYTIGILVLSNFGHMNDLRVAGIPVGRIIESKYSEFSKRKVNYGSIISVIATDCPLAPSQIGRVCKRAALGIGRVGSFAAHGSGEIIVGFSTANKIKHGKKVSAVYQLSVLNDDYINPVYDATIDATEEAIINSMTMAYQMDGVEGNASPAIDLGILSKIYKAHEDLKI